MGAAVRVSAPSVRGKDFVPCAEACAYFSAVHAGYVNRRASAPTAAGLVGATSAGLKTVTTRHDHDTENEKCRLYGTEYDPWYAPGKYVYEGSHADALFTIDDCTCIETKNRDH